LIVLPNFGQVIVGKAAEGLLDFGGVEDFIDGGGAPFGFEDNPVFEDGVVLEVEADTKIVEVAAELEFVFAAFEAVGVAEIKKFSLGNVVAGVGFEGFADSYPGFGQGCANVGELANVVFYGGTYFRETAIVGEVGGENFFEVREASA